MFAKNHLISADFSVLAIKPIELKYYLLCTLLVAGNVALPFICHLVPDGGKILLPIYFFTLIGAYKFGWRIGIMTALLSPILNFLVLGMPAGTMLASVIFKSIIIVIAADSISRKSGSFSLWGILKLILIYQAVGLLFDIIIFHNLHQVLAMLKMQALGLLIQLFLGYYVLLKLNSYGNERH